MATSFEDRIARINAKNGGTSAATVPNQPQLTGEPGPSIARNLPEGGRSPGVGKLAVMFGMTFVVGIMVIAGATLALPRFLDSEPVQIFSEAREKGASVVDAAFFSTYSRSEIEALTSPDPAVRYEAQLRLAAKEANINGPLMDAAMAQILKNEGIDMTVEEFKAQNSWLYNN